MTTLMTISRTHVATSNSIIEKPRSELALIVSPSLEVGLQRDDRRTRRVCLVERPLRCHGHGDLLHARREIRNLPHAFVEPAGWWSDASAQQRSVSGEPVDVSSDRC